MKILVITDNIELYKSFIDIIDCEIYEKFEFDFFYSEHNCSIMNEVNELNFRPINLNNQYEQIIEKYQLIFSLHCKQLFPSELVNKVRCINVHPGLNPYNRGWFPQVFSIINKYPIGVTIHEMDEQLDHGPIIVQKELKIYDWETSYDIYVRLQELEIELLRNNLEKIINNEYDKFQPLSEGNINLRKDFKDICKIDLEKKVSFEEAIDFFRAMSFKGYKNAYFYNEDGNKIFVSLDLEKEDLSNE